jgi:hypothetical protein
MSSLLPLLGFKLKQYFGPVRTDRSKLLSSTLQMGVLATLAAPWGYIMATFPGAAPPGGALATATAIFTVLLALSLLYALAGGMMVFPAEVDFVLTSPVRPKSFLHASVVFQFLAFQLTSIPFVPVMVGYAVGRGFSVGWIALALLGFEAFLLFTILLVHALGIMVMMGGRAAKVVVVALVALLFMPFLGFLLPIPAQGDIPLPSTLYVHALLLPLGIVTPFPWAPLGLMGYLAAAYCLFIWAGARDFIPHLRPNLALSFGEAIHPGLLRERLGGLRARRLPWRRAGNLRPHEGSVASVLLRLHLLRMVRQGALFMVLAFVLLLVSLPLILGGTSRAGFEVVTSTVLYAGLVGPMLVFAWNGSERPSLWVPLTSQGAATYFHSLLVASVIASLLLPIPILVVSALLLGPPPAWQVAALPLISLSSSGLAVIIALRRPLPGGATPGLGPMAPFILPILGAYLLSAPALLTESALQILGAGPTAGGMAAYGAVVAAGLWRAVNHSLQGLRE